MKLSIIMPMLNEAGSLPRTLAQLPPCDSQCEVLLVDGGSTDGSVALARRAGFRVLKTTPGRARQMNAGAAAATGDILLFLHADTLLPPRAITAIRAALVDGRHQWGRFDIRLTGRHPMLKLVARLMNLRSRLTGIATGDQAIFVTRAAFIRIGGFPEQPLMEDIELSRRLKPLSPPACLRQRASTSGRRWESRGLWRTIWLMWRLRFAYWRGTPAEQLAKAYR